MTEVWLYIAAVFALANTVLIIILVALYSSSFRRIRSPFTMGLIVFAVFFLLQNVAIIIFWFQLYQLGPTVAIVNSASPYMTVINLVETIALISLVRVTMK
ncbi:MAG TPA: hypothetical protein VED17_02305 [Nitrososphaerales archaeon]|nr:hypothetical protein [Nitrososphaerales archaeon]